MDTYGKDDRTGDSSTGATAPDGTERTAHENPDGTDSADSHVSSPPSTHSFEFVSFSAAATVSDGFDPKTEYVAPDGHGLLSVTTTDTPSEATLRDDASNPVVLYTTADTIDEDPDRTVDYYARRAPGAAGTLRDHRGRDFSGSVTPRISDDEESGTSGSGSERTRESVPGYKILSRLGRGGMGIVYEAEQTGLNRLVALKMIRDGRSANAEEHIRFLIEAEAVGRLRHPNIIQIFQIGETNGLPFVALELLEGGSLKERLGGAPQGFRWSAELLATIARGVDAAHVAGIVHRDLKPSNVLFDHEGIPKITDFGLAKRLEVDEGETRTGQVMGTPSYMPPEQAEGRIRELGPPADVYALGAILYEMLTGRPPYKGLTSAETLLMVLKDDPAPPSRLRKKIPRDLETICLKCLERDPKRRYPTAVALAEDLERYLASKPIEGRRTPAWERSIKWVKRRPVTAILLFLSVAAIVAGTTAFLVDRAETRDRRRMENARVERVRKDAEHGLGEAQSHLVQGKWDDARMLATRQRTMLAPERALSELYAKAGTLLENAQHGVESQRTANADRERYRRFVEASDDARFADSGYTGVDSALQLDATRRAARTGLGVFLVENGTGRWTLPTLPASLSAKEHAEIEEGCFELLLILADVALHTPGESVKVRAQNAVRVLDQAAMIRRGETRVLHAMRADCLAQIGDREGENREREAAKGVPPTRASDFFLSGRERAKRLDLSAAIADFEQVLARQPDHFWAQCWLAICQLQSDMPLEARPGLNVCLQRKPDAVWLYLLRGLSYAQTGAQALSLAKQFPSRSASLRKQAAAQFEAAESDYRVALQRLGSAPGKLDLSYALLVNRGSNRLQRGDLEGASKDLHAAIQLAPNRFDPYSVLGQVLQRQGHDEEAVQEFTRAIERKSDWPPLYRARAGVYLGLKDLTPDQTNAALGDLNTAIRLETQRSDLIANDQASRGKLFHREGRDVDALAACDAALAADPKCAGAHLLRLEVLLAQKRYDDLINQCEESLKHLPASAALFELRGMAREALGKPWEAVHDYSLAIDLQPKSPELLVRRATCYMMANAPDGAFADFQAAITLDEKNADAILGRGLVWARRGKPVDALSDAEAALKLGKSTTWRYPYHAARIYAIAADAAADQIKSQGTKAGFTAKQHWDRATALIQETLKRAPASERPALVEKILDDPVFQPVKRRIQRLAQ